MGKTIGLTKVAILGVGLLGGSIGLALRRADLAGRIVGFGRRRSSLDAAVDVGAIDEGFLEIAPAVRQADLVILAGPIGVFREHLAACRSHLSGQAIVTDVGSTKRQVAAWAAELLPEPVRFVGSHPIAGSDKRGIQYARADLFDGACCVVTPLPPGKGAGVNVLGARLAVKGASRRGNPRYQSAVRTIERLWKSLGMWTIRLSPEAHDAYLAAVSHLPHALAAALMLAVAPAARKLAGPGFLDTTRIAGGDPALWRDIFLTNADEVVRAIKTLNSKLEEFGGLVARGDAQGLVKFLADAQDRRCQLMAQRLRNSRLEG